MDLEEHTLEEMKENCERCGAKLTETEIKGILDTGEGVFLCTVCASESVPPADDVEEP